LRAGLSILPAALLSGRLRFLGDRKQDGKTGKENVVQGMSGGFAQAEKT